MSTTITVDGTEVDYVDWSVTVPVSAVDVAPSASITTNATESIAANDPVTITIDAVNVFEGRTRSGGTKTELGGVTLDCAHEARDLFEETVSLNETSPTTLEVLEAALSAAEAGSGFTIDYSGSAIALDNDYVVTDRSVKRVFRDITDRTSRVWWVDPAGDTIHVEPLGGRGTWKSIDTQQDKATLQQFDEGNVDTVRNAVTVNGTGEEQVSASASDSTSISTYGRRTGNSPYNVSYITTQSEAQAMANELLITDPLPQAELLVGSNVGDVTQALANQTVDLTDDGKNVDATGLVIEAQKIEQGRATLQLGAGSGVSIEELNRKTKSRGDTTSPGSVYGEDRIGDNSIVESKLADLAVSVDKIQDDAVQEAKVFAEAITETKVADDAISTPKLQAGSITAGKIDAAAVTATAIAADAVEAGKIDADAVGAEEIIADSITADEIAALALATNQMTVGADADEQIEFTVTSTGAGLDIPVMEPTADAASNLGSSTYRWRNGYFQNIDFEGGIMAPPGANDTISFGQTDGGAAVMYPSSDNTGQLGGTVGFSQRGFADVQSHNFTTLTPEPLDGVGLEKLTGYSWREPPAYVAQKKSQNDGYERRNPKRGVDLGQMTNYLLEVCKSQQERIDELEARQDELAERLSALEDQ